VGWGDCECATVHVYVYIYICIQSLIFLNYLIHFEMSLYTLFTLRLKIMSRFVSQSSSKHNL